MPAKFHDIFTTNLCSPVWTWSGCLQSSRRCALYNHVHVCTVCKEMQTHYEFHWYMYHPTLTKRSTCGVCILSGVAAWRAENHSVLTHKCWVSPPYMGILLKCILVAAEYLGIWNFWPFMWYVRFYCKFAQFMQFPVLELGLDHLSSQPFIYWPPPVLYVKVPGKS